jgi:hypothetical protein
MSGRALEVRQPRARRAHPRPRLLCTPRARSCAQRRARWLPPTPSCRRWRSGWRRCWRRTRRRERSAAQRADPRATRRGAHARARLTRRRTPPREQVRTDALESLKALTDDIEEYANSAAAPVDEVRAAPRGLGCPARATARARAAACARARQMLRRWRVARADARRALGGAAAAARLLCRRQAAAGVSELLLRRTQSTVKRRTERDDKRAPRAHAHRAPLALAG